MLSLAAASRWRATPRAGRYAIVDTLRGFAIVLMFAYHLSFDLNYFGAVRIDFNHDPFWLGFRTLIVSLFLGLVGVSLVLAGANGFNREGYLMRLGRILGCAILVSAGSYLVFPESFIYFGILHFILAASILGVPFVRMFRGNLLLGSALIWLGLNYQSPFFDQRWLRWFGLMTFKPITEDYVPLLPWFGVVLIGMFSVRRMQGAPAWPRLAQWQPHAWPARTLAWAGRHSLLIYMVHQPIFIGILWGLFRVLR